jgi:hypothetical protein
MVCEHKSYGDKAWLPFEYQGRHRGLKAHTVCSECGLVKNVSSERPMPLGYYFNVLGRLAEDYSISKIQIRLISRELMCLEDPYGFCRHQQEEVFKEIVQKYTRVHERSIKNAL